MSERKWTTHPKNGRKVIDAVTGHDICIAKAVLGEPTKAWANSRLIAAAPSLLEACQWALGTIRGNTYGLTQEEREQALEMAAKGCEDAIELALPQAKEPSRCRPTESAAFTRSHREQPASKPKPSGETSIVS